MSNRSNHSNSFESSFGSFMVPEEFQEVSRLNAVEDSAIKSFHLVSSTRTLGFEDIAKVIDEKYREVRREMILLVTTFHKEFPSSVGLKGAYSLVLTNCGNKECQLCPHSIKWRRFDCVRKNPYLDTVENAAQGNYTPDLRLYTAEIQQTTSIQSEFLIDSSGRGKSPMARNHPGRRTVVLFHPSRYDFLPGSFHKAHRGRDKRYYERFCWYNEEVKRLNRVRTRLGEMKTEMGRWYWSLKQNKDFLNQK